MNEKVVNQAAGQAASQVGNQVGNPVGNQVAGQATNQVSNQAGSQDGNQVSNQSEKSRTAEEYLAAERRHSTKNEFIDGRILGKDSSNRWHNLIATNTAIAVGSRLHGHKSDIYVNGMCVKMRNNRYCFPDVSIVSGEPAFADQNLDVLLNPAVIVEIFSGTTNSSVKTEKLENYLAMESIRECLLVKQDEMRVEHYAKQNLKQWIYRIYNDKEEVISLESVNCKVSLTEIYAQINFRNNAQAVRA